MLAYFKKNPVKKHSVKRHSQRERSPETKEKLRLANLGKKTSAETREKMRQSRLAYLQKRNELNEVVS